jgi:hypothetical protein
MPMNDFVAGDLKLAVNPARTDAIELTWLGRSNDRYPGKLLTPYYETALAEATERAVPIELHFHKLEHFNSSTITVMIQFIQEARTRAVPLVMVYDQALKWQKLSFVALRVFATDELFELRSI